MSDRGVRRRSEPHAAAARLGLDDTTIARAQARGHLDRLSLAEPQIRERPYRQHLASVLAPRPPALAFRLLGPLELLVDSEATALRRPMQRTLLALLLVRAGDFTSVDSLIDELWASDPPAAARASLHNSVCQLRKTLGAETLATGSDGYRLEVDIESIDLFRFRQGVAKAQTAMTLRCRARRLRDALESWRGPAFADIRRTPSLELEASLLDELRISTLENAIDAELQLGYDAQLVPELERLIASEPYRERPRAQLMLALYRSGRQRQALQTFKKTRHTLLSDLGLEPSPPLRKLEQAILNHDPALAAHQSCHARQLNPRFRRPPRNVRYA